MTAEALLELTSDPTSPSKARAFVSMAIREWGCDVEDRATVAVSEVVTNAIRHGAQPLCLPLATTAPESNVRVQDDDDSLPTIQPPELTSETGRGLSLVAALADDWGVEPLPDDGKAVYVAFDW